MIWIVGELICPENTTGRDACKKCRGISALIQVVNLNGAIAVPRPDLVWIIRDQNPIGPRRVGCCSVTHKCKQWRSRRYSENRVVCYVHDIDTKIVSVSQVIFLGHRVKPANVLAPNGICSWLAVSKWREYLSSC